ncbi:MAG: outer membrane beta-barrel protein [Rhodopseudomonas sp.]|nr:outer membrane beta-barrel protein [Rhodopseudomonas sp.]
MVRIFAAAFFLASIIALSQPASAAETAVHGWTGWYAGLNAGGGWGGDPVNSRASNSQFCAPPACTHAVDFANASILGATGDFPVRPDGFIGGGQFGYNWQIAKRWIAGFETDFQGLAGAGKSSVTSTSFEVSGFAGHSVATDLLASKRIDFLGTVRGRLGYLVEPRLLVFGTGGFAYGHVNSNLVVSQGLVGSGLGNFVPNFGMASSISRMLAGWTLGGGFEWMLPANWSAKVEYLYYDLGTVTASGRLADQIVTPGAPTPYYFINDASSTLRFNGNIVRIGLNYRY